ncbi:MAG: malonyl-CoA O-methyltransferase [Cellvibrionaceae bacterium]|jgi:malonyl-CoA O-methyltransferase
MKIALLHGWGCDGRIWQSIIPFLERYAEIELVDINDHIEKALVSDKLLSDAVVGSIAKKLPAQSVLCGWSLGGMLATQLAARFPKKVTALMALASNAVFVANEEWPEAMSAATFDQFFSLFNKNPAHALKRFMLLEVHGDENAKAQLQYLQALSNDMDKNEVDAKVLEAGLELLARIDNTALLEKIKCPALYVFGKNDALVPVSATELMKTKIHTGQVLRVLECSGHLLHYPEENLLTLLASFFLKLSDNAEATLKANANDR